MKKLFVWLASVSTCAAQAMSIGPFATEGWVEEKIKESESVTNGLATVSYVDDLVDGITDGFATVEQLTVVSNAIPSVDGLATVDQVTAVSNLIPDTASFATREWVGQEITNAVDDLLDGDGYIMTNLVRGSSLADKSITGDKLANNAVNGAIIANLSVSTGKLTNKAVTTSKLADNAVTKDKIDGSVTNWLATTNWVLDIVSSAADNFVTGLAAATNEHYIYVGSDEFRVEDFLGGGIENEVDPIFTNWYSASNSLYALKTDTLLTERSGFTEWTVFREGVDVTGRVSQPTWYDDAGMWNVLNSVIDEDAPYVDTFTLGSTNSFEISWSLVPYATTPASYRAIRSVKTGYQLGAQDTKPLAKDSEFQEHKANTNIHVTSTDKARWDAPETDPVFTNWLASVYPTNRVEQGSNYKMSIAQNGTVSLTPQWKYVSSSSSSEIGGIAGTVAVVESENSIYSSNPGAVSVKLYKVYGTSSQTLVYHAVGQVSDQGTWNVVTNCLDNTDACHWLPPDGKFVFDKYPDNTATYLAVRVYHGGVSEEAWSGFPSSRQLKTKILSTTDDGVQCINVGNFVDDSDGQPSYSNLRGEVGIEMVGRSGGTAFISSIPTNKPQIVIGTIEGTNAQYWIEAYDGFDGSLPYPEPRLFKQSITVPGALSAYANDTGFITTNANGSVNIEAYIAQNPTYTNAVLGKYDVVIGGGTTVFSDRTVKIGGGGVVSNSENTVVLADGTWVHDSPYTVVVGDAGANINNSSKSFILGGGGGTFVDSPRMVSFVYPGVTVERSPESIIAALGGGGARIYDSRGVLVLGDSGGEITNSPKAFVWGNNHNKIKDSMFTVVLGANVHSTNSYAFAWNQPASQTYATHGDGTFNINPVGGPAGFWIGNKNLASYLGSIDNVLYKSTTIEGSESAFQSLKYYDLLDTFVGSRRANRYISLHGALYVGEKADLVSTAFDPNPGGFTLSVGRGDTEAKGRSSVALGNNVTTADDDSFVTGYGGKVTGKIGFASGKNTRAKGNVSTATGEGTTAAGYASNSSGWYTLASAGTSQAHGKYVSAKDTDSWAWSAGFDSTNAPRASLWTAEHADNLQSLTNGFYESHGPGTFNIDPVGGPEGFWIGETNLATYLQNAGGGGGGTVPTLPLSVANGGTGATTAKDARDNLGAVNRAGDTMTGGLTVPNLTVGNREYGSTVGEHSVAEGADVLASGDCSHAEGNTTCARGDSSHAEGFGSIADGNYTHAEGLSTKTLNEAEHAQGRYNASHTGSTDAEKTIHSIGVGARLSPRNAVEVMFDGKVFVKGVGGYDGTNPTTATNLATHLEISSKLALDAIAPAFSTSSVYTNGDYVIYDRHLYECTNYTGTAGWRAGDWQQTTVTGILGNLRRILDAINGEAL